MVVLCSPLQAHLYPESYGSQRSDFHELVSYLEWPREMAKIRYSLPLYLPSFISF